MSTTRYLEVDSTYRNRNQFPLSSSFDLEISQSGQKGRLDAVDPISNASPVLFWNTSFAENGASTQITISNIDNNFSPSDTNTFLIVAGIGEEFRNVPNFYTGAVVNLRDAVATNVRRRIISYQRLSATEAQITVDSALPTGFPSGAINAINSRIENPTNDTDVDEIPRLFVPTVDTISPNFFRNFYVGNLTASPPEYRRIIEYDGILRLATLESNTTATWNNGNLNLVIRRQVPVNTDDIVAINSPGGTTVTTAALATSRAIQLAQTASVESGQYAGGFLRMIDPIPVPHFSTRFFASTPASVARSGAFVAHGGAGTNTFTLDATASSVPNIYVGAMITDLNTGDLRQVATYNRLTKAGTVGVNWTAGAAGDLWTVTPSCYGEEKKIATYIAGDGVFQAIGGAGTNTFTLAVNASNIDNFYTGALLTDVTTGETKQVTAYNGATKVGTVAVNWAAGAVGDAYMFRTVILGDAFSTTPIPGTIDRYEVEPFTRDNFNPFTYTGSLVSSQETICYEIQLVNLILPNRLLDSGRGGLPAFYPYYYVELQQISAASASQRGIIYSNNPNAYRMLFRACMTDSTSPLIRPFVTVDGDGMTHTIKFKPNDSFKFAVYLNDGELFRTIASDTTSPTVPDPRIQISAVFSFKRL